MPTTITATLRIVGVFDPEEITRELSLRPTRTWRRGETRNGAPLIYYDEDGWALKLDQRTSLHVHEGLAIVLAFLKPFAPRLKDVLSAHNSRGQVCIAVDLEEGQLPSIALSASDMYDLSAMDLSLDIDIV